MEGGGKNSQPRFLSWFPRKDRGRGGQGEGAGLAGPIAVNRSRPPPGRGAGSPAPLSSVPSPSGPVRQGKQALHSPPHQPLCGRLGPALGVGVGRGFPAGESSPGAGGGGRGWKSGTGGLVKDSSSARARPARGILGKKWPRGTGRARRGAGVRGHGPGAQCAEPPHMNAASKRNLFVFDRASMLPC